MGLCWSEAGLEILFSVSLCEWDGAERAGRGFEERKSFGECLTLTAFLGPQISTPFFGMNSDVKKIGGLHSHSSQQDSLRK